MPNPTLAERLAAIPGRFDFTPAAPFRFAADPLTDPAPVIRFDALALPWDTEVPANPFGDVISFAPGAVTVPEPAHVPFLADHDDTHVIGRADSADDHDGALWLTLAIPAEELKEPRTHTIVRQMANGLRSGVSVGVAFEEVATEPVAPGAFELRFRVTRARLLELSSVAVPRFATARGHLAASLHTLEASPVTMTDTPPDTDNPPDTPPPPPDERTTAHLYATGRAVTVATFDRHPLADFPTFAAYTVARFADGARYPAPLFALADQVTGNNPGVMPPGWLAEVQGIIAAVRPTVNALGRPAPADGLEVDWPYFDGSLSALVGEQLAQKTEITSVRVDLKKGSAALRTFAGGSDIAYQLLTRSRPSYLDAYMRIMASAYGLVTNAAAAAALEAGATAGPVIPVTGTGPETAAALFEASVQVQTATGAPASVVLASSDAYIAAGAAIAAMGAAPAGNVAGASVDAGTLDVRLAGLRIVHEPAITAGAIVTNRLAAAWFEDGPRTLAADDVAKLGRDVAVWGLGAAALFVPAGVVNVTKTPPVARSSSK
jgi:phage head maturation protease